MEARNDQKKPRGEERRIEMERQRHTKEEGSGEKRRRGEERRGGGDEGRRIGKRRE